MRLGRISFWRLAISVWGFIVIMSYAPVLAHYFFPWFDYSQYYFTVQFLDNTVIAYFNGLAEQGGLAGLVGDLMLFLSSVALKGILIMLEGVFTGLRPVWVMFGLDQELPGRSITLADMLSGMLYVFYGWTLYMAFTRGVET